MGGSLSSSVSSKGGCKFGRPLDLHVAALEQPFVVSARARQRHQPPAPNLLFIDGPKVPVADRIGEEGTGFTTSCTA